MAARKNAIIISPVLFLSLPSNTTPLQLKCLIVSMLSYQSEFAYIASANILTWVLRIRGGAPIQRIVHEHHPYRLRSRAAAGGQRDGAGSRGRQSHSTDHDQFG